MEAVDAPFVCQSAGHCHGRNRDSDVGALCAPARGRLVFSPFSMPQRMRGFDRGIASAQRSVASVCRALPSLSQSSRSARADASVAQPGATAKGQPLPQIPFLVVWPLWRWDDRGEAGTTANAALEMGSV